MIELGFSREGLGDERPSSSDLLLFSILPLFWKSSMHALLLQEGTNKHWLATRRSDVKSIVGKSTISTTRAAVAARADGGAAWTAGAAKELTSLQAKHDDRKAIALEDGHLLAKESNAAVRSRLEDVHAKRLCRDREHANAERRQSVVKRKRDSDNSININGLHLFIGDGLSCGAKAINNVIRCHSLKRVADGERHEAHLYIVPDPAKPGQRTSWAVGLTGGRIATEQFLLSGGREGASVVYTPALDSKRFLWLSPEFIKQHAVLHGIIRASMAHHSSNKWVLILRRQTFVDRYAAASKGHKNEFLALVTKSEKKKDGGRVQQKTRNISNFFLHKISSFLSVPSLVPLSSAVLLHRVPFVLPLSSFFVRHHPTAHPPTLPRVCCPITYLLPRRLPFYFFFSSIPPPPSILHPPHPGAPLGWEGGRGPPPPGFQGRQARAHVWLVPEHSHEESGRRALLSGRVWSLTQHDGLH